MSEEYGREQLSHDIQSWDSHFCQSLLSSWEKYLLLENNETIFSPCAPPYLAIQTETVELIFLTCERLDQPLPVFFLSVDVFDSFISNHVMQLFDCVTLIKKDEDGFQQYWASIADRLRGQLYLRLLSCVQLASKVVFSGRIVSVPDVRTLLRQVSPDFNADNIVKSEFRVFRTLSECARLLLENFND